MLSLGELLSPVRVGAWPQVLQPQNQACATSKPFPCVAVVGIWKAFARCQDGNPKPGSPGLVENQQGWVSWHCGPRVSRWFLCSSAQLWRPLEGLVACPEVSHELSTPCLLQKAPDRHRRIQGKLETDLIKKRCALSLAPSSFILWSIAGLWVLPQHQNRSHLRFFHHSLT